MFWDGDVGGWVSTAVVVVGGDMDPGALGWLKRSNQLRPAVGRRRPCLWRKDSRSHSLVSRRSHGVFDPALGLATPTHTTRLFSFLSARSAVGVALVCRYAGWSLSELPHTHTWRWQSLGRGKAGGGARTAGRGGGLANVLGSLVGGLLSHRVSHLYGPSPVQRWKLVWQSKRGGKVV